MKRLFKHLAIILAITVTTVITMGSIPLSMERSTLSNGTNNIVYQHMIHLGISEFYTNVGEDMIHYDKIGYLVLNEGVSGVTKEKAEELSNITGIDLSAREMLIKQTDGIVEQNLPNIGKRSDLHIDEVITEIRKGSERVEKVELQEIPLIDNISPSQRELRSDVIKMFFRFGIRMNKLLNMMGFNPFIPEHIDTVIINKRNDKLISDIEACECDVYVQYGSAHYKDFYEKMYKKGYREVGSKYYEAF